MGSEGITVARVDAQRIVTTPVHRHFVVVEATFQLHSEGVTVRPNHDLMTVSSYPEPSVAVVNERTDPEVTGIQVRSVHHALEEASPFDLVSWAPTAQWLRL